MDDYERLASLLRSNIADSLQDILTYSQPVMLEYLVNTLVTYTQTHAKTADQQQAANDIIAEFRLQLQQFAAIAVKIDPKKAPNSTVVSQLEDTLRKANAAKAALIQLLN